MYDEHPVLYMYDIQGVRFLSNYILYRYLLMMVYIVRGLRAVSLISKRDHVSSIPLLLSILLGVSGNRFLRCFLLLVYIYFCLIMMMNEGTIILLRWLLEEFQ